MKKISIFILLLLFLFITGCKQNSDNADNDNTNINDNSENTEKKYEYVEFSESGYTTFNPNLFYEVDNYEKYIQINKVYRVNKYDYSEEFFEENGLIIFVVSETSGSYRHELSFDVIDNSLDVKYNRLPSEGGTTDIKYWTVLVTIDKVTLNQIEKVNIRGIELISDDTFETKMALEMPNDFKFTILTNKMSFNSHDGSFKSSSDSEAKTIILSKKELEEIYGKLRNVSADRFEGTIYLNDEDSDSGSQIWFLSSSMNVIIYGADNPSYEWFSEMKLYNEIIDIIDNYINPKINENINMVDD